MPVWWGKKSTKNKNDQAIEHTNGIKTDKRRIKDNNKPRSFDEGLLSRNSPRKSGEISGFSDRGHPLPLPSASPRPSFSSPPGLDQGVVYGSGSASGSSMSSSGSADEQHTPSDQGPYGTPRGHCEPRLSPLRSPGRGSRAFPTATSPLHPRSGSGTNLDSPNGKQEEVRGEYHRLPLPPGSPTSPSSPLRSSRPCLGTDISHSNSNLSKWRKGKLLGRGTFGHVYCGFNSESGQMCAIKEVRSTADDQTSRECLKQLNQEIILLSQLSHPNIVRYHGSEMNEETLSVFLEYVSGGSIHKLLQEYGPFKEPVIQNYTRQILSGLAYLHGRKTVHRDIKGANILVGPNGEVKLADFGMAKHITNCSSMLSFKGSPYWMAPEVVMNTNGYSLPVDIWSLGCTILEMAAAKPPWSQYEGVAAIFKIGNSKDIPEIPEHLSNDAKRFIRLCLQRDPDARPTALKLLDHPFVRDQSISRSSNVNLTREAFPSTLDGSRTPTAIEIRSNRMNIHSWEGEYAQRPVATSSRTLLSPNDGARMLKSLPVSPSSSPMRQSGPAYKSCFLSPTHPSFTIGAQNGFNMSKYSMHPTRPNPQYPLDPWHEIPQFRSQTPPGGSPRRLI